jgi:hypothetical protein
MGSSDKSILAGQRLGVTSNRCAARNRQRFQRQSRSIWKGLVFHACRTLILLGVLSIVAQGSVIVITNRAATAVDFQVRTDVAEMRELTIACGDCFPVALSRPARISFISEGQRKEFRVVPKGLYYFFAARGKPIEIAEIGLHTPKADSANKPNSTGVATGGGAPQVSRAAIVIPIKILFDDAEITNRAVWEARSRERIDEASRLFKKYCFAEFKIVAIDNWQSDASITRLDDALSEFEQQVDPTPARLAIGFTGRQRGKPPDGHLGITRGPLHTHVLIREWVNQNTEQERLEILVHELGHFLGAVHSPELNSVMRANLGDRQARAAAFRIVFDPLNTLAMCLVSQELNSQGNVHSRTIQLTTRDDLRRIYSVLLRANPDDPTAELYLRALSGQARP